MAKYMLLCLVLLEASLLVSRAAGKREYHGYKLLRLTPQRISHLEWLRELPSTSSSLKVDFWTEPTTMKNPVDIMLSPEQIEIVTEMLVNEQLPYEVILDDVQSSIRQHTIKNVRALLAAGGPGLGNGVGYDFRRYMRYNEIMLWLENVISTSINCQTVLSCENILIGKTHENRDQRVIKISSGSGPSGPKKKVWVDAGIHAREWISPAVAMYFIERLINDYFTDPEVMKMIDTYDFYILPLINGDGYEYTHTTERLWRKSRTKYPQDACYGTDINRNFNHMWNTIGVSNNSCEEIYCGPYAESEVEAKNLADYMLSMKGEWDFFLTLHSYGQLWMAPWGYSEDKPEDYEELMRVGEIGVSALEAVHGNKYVLGSASEILYQSSGTSRDWAYGIAKIPYVYTIELPPGRDIQPGFLLPPEFILSTVEETWAGFQAAIIAVLDGPNSVNRD